MIKRSRQAVGNIRQKTGSFFGWLRDPWCGDRFTRPISREIAGTGESTWWILTHRGLNAFTALAYKLLVDIPLFVAKFVGGVLKDLRRSDYRYTRYYGGMLISAVVWSLKTIVDIVVTIAVATGRLLQDLIKK
ncbi:hypothetical protein [Natronosalvus caseinilyticus]|uniref:hypothetical protein n=1 Tax=Natronosalvus caseinilyticus TaxID=2953747 RepID=UPI0028B08B15|nr:hypothetical protein [Natronosalvus caseinilyticus]